MVSRIIRGLQARYFRRVSIAILALALASNSFGAISAAMVWELRTTGNAANGCGFKTGATGMDYTLQDAAQYSLTGVTTAGAGATALTASAAADMVGNIGNVTAGTNFTTGRREIISVVVGVSITFDANIATGVGAAGTIEIGGACTLHTQIAASVVAGNTVWFKAGTFTQTTTGTYTPGATGPQVLFSGYTATRGDNGVATVTTATNSIKLFTLNAAAGYRWQNLILSNSAGTRDNCLHVNGVTIDAMVTQNVVFSGCANAINCDAASCGVTVELFQTEIKNTSADAMHFSRAVALTMESCYVHDITGDGLNISGNFLHRMNINNSVFADASGDGIELASTSNTFVGSITNSVFYSNGGRGVNQSSNVRASLYVLNSVFYGNTSEGIAWNATTAPETLLSYNNAFGANSSPHSANWPTGVSEVTLTADPFTSAGAGNDYSLNNTAGGGAALRGTGFPGVYTFGTGFLDIGALQVAAAAAATQRIYGGTQ